jgi:hypothetical protein
VLDMPAERARRSATETITAIAKPERTAPEV